jgi:hypothetical protein
MLLEFVIFILTILLFIIEEKNKHIVRILTEQIQYERNRNDCLVKDQEDDEDEEEKENEEDENKKDKKDNEEDSEYADMPALVCATCNSSECHSNECENSENNKPKLD